MKMEYSVFKVVEKKFGRRNLFDTGLWARAGLLGIVFAECVHFLFSRIREYCRDCFVCSCSMLAAKMFVYIQTRNYN